MLEAKEREAEGQRFFTIQQEMGTTEYRLRKAMGACSGKSVKDLRKDLDSAYQVEKDIKGGTMSPRLCLELFIAGL